MRDADLAALARIAKMRRERADRHLTEARAAHRAAIAARATAKAELQRQQEISAQATTASYADPANPQTWLWRGEALQRQEMARTEEVSAANAENACREDLSAAAHVLRKTDSKQDHVHQLQRAARKVSETRIDEAANDELQSGLNKGVL